MKWNKNFNGLITLVIVFVALSFIGNGIVNIHNYHVGIRYNHSSSSKKEFRTDYFDSYKKFYDLNEKECRIAESTIESISVGQRDILFNIIYEHLMDIEENLAIKQENAKRISPNSDENEYLLITFLYKDIVKAMETPPGEIIKRMFSDETIRPIPNFFEYITSVFTDIYMIDPDRYAERYNEAIEVFESFDLSNYLKE